MIVLLNILALIYIIYCTAFKIGNDFYGGNIIYLGGLQNLGAYLFVYSLPVFLWGLVELKKKKTIIYISIFISIIIPVLIFKRTFIFLEIFILLLFFVFFGTKFKYFFRSILIFILILSGLYIFRSDIYKMIEIRRNRIETKITDEGRFLEYEIIWAEQIKGNNIKKLLFGNELFNNKSDFGKKKSFGLDTTNRFFHSEVTEIIYSTGIIGIILYIRFLFLFFKFFLKKSKKNNKGKTKTLKFLFLSIFLLFFINGFVEQWCTYFARAFPLFILGFVAAMKNSMLKNSITNKNF
jgi:oligosaccharide repeat unit polymerase